MKNKNNISVYIHWPFCKSLCPYCDFNSHIAESLDHNLWSKSYIKELEYFEDKLSGKNITSVFFGGGTPSLMDPRTIESILNYLSKISDISTSEITIEANPTSSEASKFSAFKNAGINRISLGIQALIDKDLKSLGRMHDSLEAIKAIELAASNFENYSFDLIYARPDQNLESWKNELDLALSLSASHISLYQLTIEKGTPFYKLFKNGKLKLPSDDLAADFFDITNQMLSNKGFKRYEISNYAKQGFECKHNLVYWRYNQYLGIGPGAHSRIINSNNEQEEIVMHHMPAKWLSEVSEKGAGIQKKKIIHRNELINEIVMMGLRISEGLPENELFEKTGKNFADIFDMNYLNMIINEDFAEITSNNILKLSDKGLNLHSFIVSRILNI